MKNLSLINKRSIIAVHAATTGPGHDVRDYILQQGIKELLFIVHPLLYLPSEFKNVSRYELYKNGKLIKDYRAIHWQLPELFLYIKDSLYTLIWSMQFGQATFFIGLGNLNACIGIILKMVRAVNIPVYYVIDYIPNRFRNRFLNMIYHRIEKFCAENSQATWNLSPRMIAAREEKWGKNFPHQIVVPHGVHFKRIKRVGSNSFNKREVVYMGTLLEKQGIQLLLSALPTLIKSIPNLTVSIIGKGPYEGQLRKLVKKLHLESNVVFLGYISNHTEVESRIAKAALTIALYNNTYDEFTYYADPGKIKNYLGAGVPVLLTDVPYIAREVDKAKCGIVVSYSKNSIIHALIDFFSDETKMVQYRKNAIKFSRKYDWDNVFTKAFEQTYKEGGINSLL